MSFQEKNHAVSLVSFTLILVFFVLRVFQLMQNGNFDAPHLFWLWGIVAVMAVGVTIAATILTHIVLAIVESIRSSEKVEVQGIADERDKMIDLQGAKVSYQLSSIGVALSMLTFVLGQPPLMMFTSLIFFGVVAQIIGDVVRLYLYRKGF